MADQAHIKRERAKARELRDSQWWKNQIGPGICYHCGKKFPKSQLTMDHLTPLARGGKTTKSNVVPSCKACNQTRGQKLDVERALESLDEQDADQLWLLESHSRLIGSSWEGVNCFSVSQVYFDLLKEESLGGGVGKALGGVWRESFSESTFDANLEGPSGVLKRVSADEMLSWVAQGFMQIEESSLASHHEPVLILIWSRSTPLPDLQQKTDAELAVATLKGPDVVSLSKKQEGFPFGWVLEHSTVLIEPYQGPNTRVLEKVSPDRDDLVRISSLAEASEEYLSRVNLGFTFHLCVD